MARSSTRCNLTYNATMFERGGRGNRHNDHTPRISQTEAARLGRRAPWALLPLLQPDRPEKRAVTAVGPHCVVSKGEQRATRWRLSHPDERSSGSWYTDSSHETLKHSCARRITLVADAQFGSGTEPARHQYG